jgi:hypothetical protein
METDAEIKALLSNPATTSWWLVDALKTALIREPLDAAEDAEFLARLLSKRAAETTAQNLAWLAVQKAQTPPHPE